MAERLRRNRTQRRPHAAASPRQPRDPAHHRRLSDHPPDDGPGPEEFEATAGDIVRIDADQAHGYSNRGPDVARFSATIDSDMSDFFEGEARTRDLLTVVANSDSTRILAA